MDLLVAAADRARAGVDDELADPDHSVLARQLRGEIRRSWARTRAMSSAGLNGLVT